MADRVPIWNRLGSPERIREAMKRCVHFNGIQNNLCDAGVDYDSFGPRQSYRRELPCWEGAVTKCPEAQFRTYEEQQAIEREVEDAAAAYVTKLASNVCPVCDSKVERQKQVEPCVYAEPCGHRLYQGKAGL